MKATDIIFVNVTGTHPNSRQSRTISEKFNGLGEHLNDAAAPSGRADRLRNLPTTNGASTPPAFPMDKFVEAQQANDVDGIQKIQLAYAEQLDAYKKSQGGGSETVQVAKSVIEYCVEFHGFRTKDDGDFFIIKPENLEVTQKAMPNGSTQYSVAGAAVFGA